MVHGGNGHTIAVDRAYLTVMVRWYALSTKLNTYSNRKVVLLEQVEGPSSLLDSKYKCNTSLQTSTVIFYAETLNTPPAGTPLGTVITSIWFVCGC